MIFKCLIVLFLLQHFKPVGAKQHTDFIIIGGTGDLARKYLWRSALKLYIQHADETNGFSFIAASRLPEKDGTLALNQIIDKIKCLPSDDRCISKRPEFVQRLKYVQLKSADNYTSFCQKHAAFSQDLQNVLYRRIFYFSVPSSAYESVAKNIHEQCRDGAHPATHVVLEKPFGSSKITATKQAKIIGKYFSDDEIFRVDHYLAKSVTKQILKFRQANQDILKNLQSRQFIDRIEVVMKETIGVKDRIDFYDQNGVVRDVMQNHLTELLALVIMDIPSDLDNSNGIEEMKLRCLRKMKPVSSRQLLLGQYANYLNEAKAEKENISQSVNTPTFAAALLQNSNNRWDGVPMILMSGKHLDERSSYVRVLFREREFCVSGCVGGNSTLTKYPRQIVFQIGHGDVPSAGILVSKSLFKPVWPSEMKELSLTSKDTLIHGQNPGDFHYGVPLNDRQAYDAVFEDLFLNVKDTFVTTERMLLLWDIWDGAIEEASKMTPRKYLEEQSSNLNFKVEDFSLQYTYTHEDSVVEMEELQKPLYAIPSTFRNRSLFCRQHSDNIKLLAEHIYKSARSSVNNGNDFHIAFSGGKTPIDLFTELAYNFPVFPWQHTHIWQVDERCVSHRHKDSNFLSIYENLLKFVQVPYFNIHPMLVNFAGRICDKNDSGDKLYESSIKHLIREQKLDIVILGLGTDGHIASLFPNSEHLHTADKLVSFTKSKKGGNLDRISLLLPAINKAKEVTFLVTGADKHEIIEKIKDIGQPDINFPVTFVGSNTSEISWYIDLSAWTGVV